MNNSKLSHPSTNYYASDTDPHATERAVLEVLAELPLFHTLTGRVISYRIYGMDFAGRQRVASAIGRLKNRKLLAGDRRYRITDAGRLWLRDGHVFEPDGGAA